MSNRELVIELKIPLAGEMFEDAATITAVQGIYEAISERAASDLEEGSYSLLIETPTSRKPRGLRSDAGKPRGPRTKNSANGADAETVTA